MKIRKKQNSLKNMSAVRIIFSASAIFILFFVLLFSMFASAAKLSTPKVVMKEIVLAGSAYKTTVSSSASNQAKYVEICRGTIKKTCKVIAKDIRGVKISALIPASYSSGDANIKISYKNKNKKAVLVSSKTVKIIGKNSSVFTSSSSSSGSSSSGSSTASDDDDFGASSPTTSSSGTPTPTPQGSVYKDVKPVLISH